MSTALVLGACVRMPRDAFVVTPEELAQREMETRRYDGIKEGELLVASEEVLQDLGFNLENSDTKLGVLTASKQRSATSTGGILAAMFLGWGGASKDQVIRVCLVVRPVQATSGSAPAESHFVRITFQRIVRRFDNSHVGQTLNKEELYEIFFAKLSKSVFIEAQRI